MKIDAFVPAVMHSDLQAPKSCDAAHQRIDHRLHKRAADCGVHSIPAVSEDNRARLNRFGLWGDYHAFRHAFLIAGRDARFTNKCSENPVPQNQGPSPG
jgi:hypothetical protein